MSKATIAVPMVTEEETDHLIELRRSVRRVHKSVPAHSQVRRTSTELSDQLQRLHRRGVPLHTLADIVGLSHQAVRIRVRGATTTGADGSSTSTAFGHTLTQPVPGVVLVADAGVHRRLHIFDPPEDAGPAYLAMIPSIPLLEEVDDVMTWLESESDDDPVQSDSHTATRLRVPPAVYLPRGIVGSVLVPLTTEESRSGDVERSSDSA
jgi:hypothetical protein